MSDFIIATTNRVTRKLIDGLCKDVLVEEELTWCNRGVGLGPKETRQYEIMLSKATVVSVDGLVEKLIKRLEEHDIVVTKNDFHITINQEPEHPVQVIFD